MSTLIPSDTFKYSVRVSRGNEEVATLFNSLAKSGRLKVTHSGFMPRCCRDIITQIHQSVEMD